MRKNTWISSSSRIGTSVNPATRPSTDSEPRSGAGALARALAPHAPAATTAENLTVSAHATQDAEIYNRLVALGLPAAITLEDFARILSLAAPSSVSESRSADKGKSTQPTKARGAAEVNADASSANDVRRAIEFLSVHLVGREEARKARARISSSREAREQAKVTRPTSRIKAPTTHTAKVDDILDDPLAAAIASRDMAYRNLESVRREYALATERSGALDEQKRELVRELEEKRRVAFLLRVLEKRETVRLERIGKGSGECKGITTLVDDLRQESALAVGQLRAAVGESMTASSSVPRNIPSLGVQRHTLKYKHTTEALANLHALHIRHTRREASRKREAELAGIEQGQGQQKSGNEPATEPIIERLEGLLGRLGIKDEAGVDRVTAQLVAVARQRAAARRDAETLKILNSGADSMVDEAQLSTMHAANEETKQEVQTKINRAVALGCACEGYIDLISTFRAETAPALHAALDAEGKRVMGYVDALCSAITQRSPNHGASFAQEVRDIVGTPRVAVADVVRDMLVQVSASEKMVSARSEAPVDDGWPEIIVDSERNKKLLERKAMKMEYGFGIAEEVLEVLAGVRKLK